MNNTLLDWLATGPDKQKLVSFNHTNIIKGQDFCDKVSCFYSQLQQHPEQRWLLSANDSSIFAAALCAGLLAGKTIILPANTQPGTIANIEHAFDGILSTQELSKNHPFIPLNQAITKSNSSWPRAASLGDIVLYTSGSSGQPKSVTKSLTQLDAEVSTLEQTFASAMGQCSIISTVSHQHIYGLLFTVLWPLCTQRPFLSELIAYPETLSYYLTLMPNLCLISSPAQLSRLPNALENQLQQQSPRLIFSSGGALSANAAQGMFNCYHQFPIEVFGSTETGGIAYRQQTTSQTPWQVFTGISIKQAANGALQIQSPYLPNSTTWHTCDDSVELLSPEQFTLLGRLDRTVKVAKTRLISADGATTYGQRLD